jgi:S1-C subfamily serine protease
MTDNHWRFACIVLGLAACMAGPAFSQQLEHVTKADAPLVVDGIVRQIFRSIQQGSTDYLVQIETLRCEGRKSIREGARPQFPGPGESVYVHIAPNQDQTGRLSSAGIQPALPEENSKVRVYLYPRGQGSWEGASSDWYENIADRMAEASSEILSPSADKKPAQFATSNLGITTEALHIENHLALRVTSVERGGAAQEAGLEEGDVIVGAEGAALQSADRFEELARKGTPFSLIVIDVNTGRGAQIEVKPRLSVRDRDDSSNATAQPSKISLGLSAEPVKLGSRSALKVTRVEPNSAAAKSGIEAGDILVAANGLPTTGPEQLVSALRKSGAVLKLTVRDSRNGADVDVDVPLSDSKSTKPLPTDKELPTGTPRGQLGVVTELAFHNDEFAVKVTEIEPGSPASRAGLQPGALILAANGKLVLHPNELNDAVRTSAGTLTLTVVDPITGKKENVEINVER